MVVAVVGVVSGRGGGMMKYRKGHMEWEESYRKGEEMRGWKDKKAMIKGRGEGRETRGREREKEWEDSFGEG